MMDYFFRTIHRYHRIRNRGNDFSFSKYYLISVHNKTIFKTINMKTVFEKIGIFLNISSWTPPPPLIVFDWENPRWEYYLYIMCENYRTKARYWFSSLTAHTRNHYTTWNIKYAVPEFPIFPMIMYLNDSSISDTYSFMFYIQSTIVRTSPKAKAINEMICSLYPCGFLFRTIIIIARILILFDFMKSSHSCSSNYWFNHHK